MGAVTGAHELTLTLTLTLTLIPTLTLTLTLTLTPTPTLTGAHEVAPAQMLEIEQRA